jgi:hypothetical protein
MTLFLVHMAIPEARLSVAKSAAGLSGRDDEYSVPLQSLDGKPAAAWDGEKTYTSGHWLGASQRLSAEFLQPFMADSQAKKTEAFFAAYLIDGETLTPYLTNFPDETFPTDATFEAFLAKFGLEYRPAEVIELVKQSLVVTVPRPGATK